MAADDTGRLKALRSYGILDTDPEQAFDDLALLASHICRTPIALVSLLDENRQWFKAHVGLEFRETARSVAFCAHAIEQQGIFIVEDALNDPRFRDNALVLGEPQIRFYAGAPLVTRDGDALGTICVIDRVARTLTDDQKAALDALRRQVEAQLEARRDLAELRAARGERDDTWSAAVAVSARAQLIVDTALDAVITIDQESRVTSWNTQAEATFGWARGDAVGRELSELVIPPQHREAHAAGMRRYLSTGESRVLNQRIEIEAQDRDGRRFPVELAITPLHDGERLSFSAFVRDISARKRHEQLLATQFEVTRVLAAATGLEDAAPLVLSAAGRLLEWDGGALWLLDVPADVLRASHVWQADDAVWLDFMEKTRALTLSRGVGLPGRILANEAPLWIADVTREENFPRAAEALTVGLRSAIGVPVAVSGRVEGVLEFFSRESGQPDQETLRVLTGMASQLGLFIERVRAELALRRSANQLRAVIYHMLDGLVIVDRGLRIVQCNSAFARMFGYELEELSGVSAAQLLPDRPEYQEPARLGDMLRESLGRITDREGRRRNGDVFPLQAQLYEVETPEGSLIGVHVRDLSETREVDRLKKRFIASVSHELRTPLTAIRGALGLLAQSVGGALPPEARQLVSLAERNAVRLSSLISDILDFERIESGLLSLKREVFPIDEAVARMLDTVNGSAAEAGISLVTPASGLSAYGDQARIEQVLVNLVSNAIKFSAAGTQVEIEASGGADKVEVRVSDRGRGVPPEQRAVIFELFRQTEDSDARVHGGAGLGLAICWTIIRQHGGEIGVESRPGGGSIFWFSLPVRAREQPATA